MIEKVVTTQGELDQIHRVEAGEKVIIKTRLRLNARLEVFGVCVIEAGLDCGWDRRIEAWGNSSVVARENSIVEAWGNSIVVARENSSVVARENSIVEAWGNSIVEAWGNSSVVAWENSSIVAWDNSSIKARDNSIVEAWGNSIVEARENSSIVAWDNSSVEAWGNSIVEAWGNSNVVAWENSSIVAWDNSSIKARDNSNVEARDNSNVVAWDNSNVEARGNSSIEAWGNVFVRAFSSSIKLALHGFSILSIPADLALNFEKESTVSVQKYQPQKYLDREGVSVIDGKVVLFKRVSCDLKTQENMQNETLWRVGSTVIHPKWSPVQKECGPGKFHACSQPYFANDFRSVQGDRYIAIEIAVEDLYEWPNPDYIHKIAFRSGQVLYECDRLGKKKEVSDEHENR